MHGIVHVFRSFRDQEVLNATDSCAPHTREGQEIRWLVFVTVNRGSPVGDPSHGIPRVLVSWFEV